ncbi:GH20775 [Drosophila grimshawi]|uniref:GH20775 n=2 Tax=Drosophila grimshawi TaxID=7222 RepID=B4J6A7_DROGR|nr:GH20775 [Drosophila grimshawi]
MAVFASDGSVIQRGCSDNLATTCSDEDTDCYECRSSGCNNLKTNTQMIDCLACDAQDDESCVFDYEVITDTRKCNEKCITALYSRTSDEGSPLELVRTCLDDLDLDDRDACVEGTLPNCAPCSTSKCNTADMGARGMCNFCTDGKCDKPESKTCRAVAASGEEQCFIQLDESGKINELGCLSQYNISDAAVLQSEKRLWLCSGWNCNVISALPTEKTCKVCSSRTDPDCAIEPSALISETECSHPLFTDCYTLLRDDGNTERGCLTTLDTEDYVECAGGLNATKCVTCSGDNCNIKLQPETERLTCHICDSSVDDTCEGAPNAESLCLLHQLDQKCVTTIDSNGNTLRGCASSLSCVSDDSKSCNHCLGKNCNNQNLKRRADGQPGQWGQELPLSCQSCTDSTTCASSNLEEIACAAKDEYCMTVFDDTGKVNARGCSNVVEASFGDYCDANTGKCHNCNSNGCNSATSLDSYNECVYCDASQNEDCVKNPPAITDRRLCNGQCMTAIRKQEGTDLYALVRGCLDDKDAEDQATCAAGTDKECVACTGDACNMNDVIGSSLSCYICDNKDNCQDPDQAACLHFSPTDRCYTLFDDTASVASLGCLSDQEPDFVDKNLENLILCTENNCNSFENLPKPNECAICSSLDDVNCAVDPSKVTQLDNCNVMPQTSCMSRIHSDGSTQRGCVSNLAKAELRSCLLGEGNCEMCEGSMCNIEIYPADRRRCQRCNSNDDPNCGSAPDASGVCPRHDDSKGCSVKLVNGATYRGCETEFVCDPADKQYCRSCSGDNCNVVDLEIWNIGYPGKWATPPINCYTCEGVECQGSSLGSLQKCANNNEQNCATVFASDGSVILRGCTDQLYADAELTQYCDATPGSCKQCKSSGCNNAKQLDAYVDCVLCDGTDQAACVRSVGDITRKVSCQGSCFTGLYARSKVDPDSPLEMARGCLDDLEYDDRLACADGNMENCVACTEASCNKNEVPEERLSCNYCDDEECDEISSQTCVSYRSSDQCYIHVGDLKIESMGCASDLETSFLQLNRRDLYLCSGKDCNTKDVLNLRGNWCVFCNSKSQSSCIEGTSLASPLCEHYLTPDCYTHIDDDGVLHRGCLMDKDDELFDDCTSGNSTTCEICMGDFCNNELYPADRQSCLQCDSETDEDCEKNPATYAKYCRIYESGDVCVTSLENGRTRRGCQSEVNCDASQVGKCRICEDGNCNSVNLAGSYVGEPGKWQDLPLSCHVCTDLESCASVTTPTKCEGNNKQLCSTVFNVDGNVIARGCSDAVIEEHASYCESDIEKCPLCKSNGCNNADSLDTYVECYQCDAEHDPNCAWEKPTKTRQCQSQCMTGMYPRSSAVDSALLPTRGCLDDLEQEDRDQCAEGKHASCTACSGPLCNGEDIVKTPQECYVCEDSECVDAITSKCLAYKEKDQCYLAFVDQSIVGMGCASDFETEVINELVAQGSLLLCEGQNCNYYDIIPDVNICLQCNSLIDPRCATNPNQLLTTSPCASLPYTQCVTHVDAAGTTTRGCLSDVESTDFYDCLMGNSAKCQTCTGSNCNGLTVFPADRRLCHQCDSASDPLCASAPSSSAVCPIYDEKESCVTTLVNDITHRGCGSSLSCSDPSDSNTCRICSDNACNTIDLNRLNIHGSPGIWQQTPISCLTCANAEECKSGSGQLEKCSGNDNCATVFDATGDVVTSRGCYNALDTSASSYCDSQPDNCPRCNSNGCNVADSLNSYVECLVCDSSADPNCVNDVSKIHRTRQCNAACMSAFRPLFGEETSNPSYALVRNCNDDLEEEDRTSCGTEANKHCASCTDAMCNKDDLVAERHSCLICRGDDCQDPQPASCANYRETDECFIQFDEQRSIVAHGCLSEYSHEDIHELQRSKRLLTCKDDNCNTLDLIQEPQTCVLCSSRTDLNCADNPGGVNSETSCLISGLPECYSRVLQDGSTERGCLSSLEDDEFLGCYDGTAKGCSSCVGDHCNKKIYPTDRTSCHICNSETDPNCESTPSSLSICPLYAEEDTCVTNLRGDITYRGCSSSISCEPNSKTCVICSGDGCNVADLNAYADDNHGKWQDLPLTCLTCTGDGCLESSISSERCEANNEQDCMTVFNADGVVTGRGCQDVIEQDATLGSYCANNADKCPVCKSNDCNSATAITQYNSCIYCDSFKSTSCLWDPTSTAHKRRQCQGDCMTALYGSAEDGLDLIRTCLNDKEQDAQLVCSADKDANCASCSGDACNVQSLPTDRVSCFHCENGDCEEPTTKLCAIYKPNDSCYLWVDEENSIKQLGCLSSFRDQDLESVIKTKRIAVCEGNNCNTPQMPSPVKCAICDSRTDPTCATTPLAVAQFKTCNQFPHPQCMTRLEDDGSTIRGCLYDLPQAHFAGCLLGNDENCEVCEKDGCNRDIFPADRQQCYTCTSSDDSSCVSNPTQAAACALLTDEETCQTSLDSNVTIRGCSSSVKCSASDYHNCRNCVGSKCNSIDLANRVDDGQHGLFQELPLKCHTCAGEHCLSSLGPAVKCTPNVEQDCKTVFELDGKIVRRRGCADDVDDYEDLYCRQNPTLCVKCKSNECNDAWNLEDLTTCIFCNSAKDSKCVTYPQSADLESRQCQGKCMVAMSGHDLVRSCLSDKELFDRTACTSDESGTNCATCDNGECNTFAYPADRLSCHVCTDANNCDTSRAESCAAYDKDDFCFAKYKDGVVDIMGCASNQNSDDLDQWRSSNLLYECKTKDCNELTRLPSSGTCISCDSSKTPECAQSPTEVSTTDTCHAPLADCVTRLENGHTIRGCLNSLASNEGDACVANGTCASCAGSKCNVDIFPINRRKCHICNSVANSDCAAEPNHLAICPIYAADDTCVSSRDADGYIQRSCGSGLECEIDDEDHCQVCNTDGCNTVKFNGSAALSGIGLILTLAVSLVTSGRWL